MRRRGAVAAPEVDGRHPVRTAIQLFRQRWWLLGYGVATVAWLLHVASLKLAPLSLVHMPAPTRVAGARRPRARAREPVAA
jgi:hypothetical protein